MTTNTKPNTKIISPGAEKFTPPTPPMFPTHESILSASSLFVFACASIGAIVWETGWPWWAVAPFWFTALGSVIGFLYELQLIISGKPYQLFGSRIGRFIQAIRAGNLAFVFGSAYLAYALTTFGNSANVDWLIVIVGILAGFLLALFLFQGPQQVAAVALTLALSEQILLVASSPDLNGNVASKVYFILAAIGLFSTTLIGADSPKRSTLFHLLGVVVVLLLFLGFRSALTSSPISTPVDSTILRWLLLLISFFGGSYLAFRFVPITWGVFRSLLANATWPLFYLIIAGGMRFPRPAKLSEIYKTDADLLQPLSVMPYYVAHRRAQTHAISIPSLDEALTLKVQQGFRYLLQLVKLIFNVASVVSRVFPFANIDVPLAQKPRMERWSDGSEYWPDWLLQTIYIPTLGWFKIESGVQGPGFQPTPTKAIELYRRGQLLAYLVEFSIAGSFIEAETHEGGIRFKLDFSFLEKYESKNDYEPYGGTAFFVIDDIQRCLKLTAVRAPWSNVELKVDPTNAAFRHAEDLILASVYFYVVSCKHLVEIHMGLNLLEVALVNSFDANNKRWDHPVRLALYPHLFAHELAEELTTENLLEDKAVFPQIFATTNSALMQHLNDRFSEYELAKDENFEGRERVLLTGRGSALLADVLPHSSLIWEKEYAAIWQEYADSLVDANYPGDSDVADDGCIQMLFANMTALYHQSMPLRYAALQTKQGLSRFISDTMHHLIIRHEVYGTTGVRLALDPRISKVQVPKDGGPSAIDEWRSLACIAMATSRVRYTKLMIDFKDVFDDIKDDAVRARYCEAHDRMKLKLRQLEDRYNTDGVNNYETLRLLPSLLDIGAGY